MSKIAELKNLISSLSKSEKRYFKLYSSLHTKGEQNNYVKLFDAIEYINQDNEKLIKEKFLSLKGSTSHFAYTKNYLHELILKSLNAYHINHSISSQLSERLAFIEQLYKKSLYIQCEKEIRKAKKLAIDHERFPELLSVLYWEHRMSINPFFPSGKIATGKEIMQERAQVLKSLDEIFRSESYISDLINQYRKEGYRRKKRNPESFKKYILSIIDESARLHSKNAKIKYFVYIALKYQEHNDLGNAYSYSKKSLALARSLDMTNPENTGILLTVYHNYLFISKQNQQYKNFIIAYKAFKKIPADTDDLRIRKAMVNMMALEILLKMGDFKTAYKEIQDILTTFEQYQEYISEEELFVIYFAHSYISFGLADYKTSEEFLSRILQSKEKNVRHDISAIAKIFNLILHYEMGNYIYAENIIRSTERFLKKKDKLYKLEALILKIIKKMLSRPDKNKKAYLIPFMEELKMLATDPGENVVYYYFNFDAWLKSKINNTSLEAEIKKQQSKNLPNS